MNDSESDDPIQYFITDMEKYDKPGHEQEDYRDALQRFEMFLVEQRGVTLSEARHRDCMAWLQQLREAPNTPIDAHISHLSRFYAYMNAVDVFDTNPVKSWAFNIEANRP